MEPHELTESLRQVEVFASLSDDDLAQLQQQMRRVVVPAGAEVFREGEPGDRMYVIARGRLRVTKQSWHGAEVEVGTLAAGDCAGVMSLFAQRSRSATLRALEEVEVWELGREDVDRLLERRPKVAAALLRVLSGYLRRSTSLIADLTPTEPAGGPPVAVFDTKPYTRDAFLGRNDGRFTFRFIDTRLSLETVPLAGGCTAICAFVNDVLDADVVRELAALGVQHIALRCAGFNNVDLDACATHRITVTRVPAYSPYAVAEHAAALMLALNRHIHRAHQRVREGNFSLDGLVGFDLHGKTVGLVGTGKIGRCFASIVLGFGCRLLAFDPFPHPELLNRDGVSYVDLPQLFAESDVISLHAPLTPATQHLIDDAAIARMKPGVMILNTSRGGLIDTEALIRGLLDGRVDSAGLDVYEEEADYFFEDFSDQVITDDILARLTTFPNVLVTSHMAFLTREALRNIADVTLANLAEFAAGKRGGELSCGVSLD